jgi:hypothetical protein
VSESSVNRKRTRAKKGPSNKTRRQSNKEGAGNLNGRRTNGKIVQAFERKTR